MDFVAIDFEKAGNSQLDICEVALVKYKDGNEIDTFHSYIKPISTYCRSKWADKHLTHITQEMLENAPAFTEVYESMKSFIADNLIVCHGVGADINYIYNCEKYLGISGLYKKGYADTNEIGGSSSIDVKYASIFGETMSKHHHALDDARACGKVFAYYCDVIDVTKYIHKAKYVPSKNKKSETTRKTKFGTHCFEIDKRLIITNILNLNDKQAGMFSKSTMVISGVSSAIKEELKEKLYTHRSKISSSISNSTDVVIFGSNFGPSKQEQIVSMQQNGCPIKVVWFEDVLDFLERYRTPWDFDDIEFEDGTCLEGCDYGEICFTSPEGIGGVVLPDAWFSYVGISEKDIKKMLSHSLHPELINPLSDVTNGENIIVVGNKATKDEIIKVIEYQCVEKDVTVFAFEEVKQYLM